MLSFLNQISLIRYLIVWKVNSSLAFIPRYLSVDISKVIGSIIAQRLPTSERGVWKKAIDPLVNPPNRNSKNHKINLNAITDSGWPIHSAIFTYPSKRAYGKDEFIFWELKLFGEHTDHGLFLEVILPAMEEASYTSDPQWNQRNRLWGHFDIHRVCAARGNQWEPVVLDGKLDLRYRANPFQWQEQLRLKPKSLYRFTRLNWMSPFDLSEIIPYLNKFNVNIHDHPLYFNNAPTLSLILMNFIFRVHQLLRGRSKIHEQIGDFLTEDDRKILVDAFQSIIKIPIKKNNIKSTPPTMPGKWMGTQQFQGIPRAIIPYFELASILHIGKFSHFGCGTFVLR